MEDKKQCYLGSKKHNFLGSKKSHYLKSKQSCILSDVTVLTTFDVACVNWVFDLFGSFKMEAHTVQCVYKGFKLMYENLECYLLSKKHNYLGCK